jgi:hypothetical protein
MGTRAKLNYLCTKKCLVRPAKHKPNVSPTQEIGSARRDVRNKDPGCNPRVSLGGFYWFWLAEWALSDPE